MTNRSALLFEMIPRGISRIAVRGFFTSNSTSSQRLKAMAALRAKTMQPTTSRKTTQMGLPGVNIFTRLSIKAKEIPPSLASRNSSNLVSSTPSANPIIAKGIAKMVCENRIKLK